MQLQIDHVSKTYPNGVRALDDVTLTIRAGMFGLLGPNGAGKSTLMRTIATLQQPDRGSIRFGDIDVVAHPMDIRKLLGYLPQEFGLYPNLSAERVLDHFASLKGVTDAGERRDVVKALLQQTNLYEERKKRVGGFSGGMKQRLGIALALIGSPQLIVVDEPTAGLDPTERQRFLNLLAEIGRDVVVILSTHIVADVREMCDQMAIIDKGQVILSGEPARVLESARGRVWRRRVTKEELITARGRADLISVRRDAGEPVIHVFGDASPGEGFTQVDATLEDVYFRTLSVRGASAALVGA